MNTTSAIQATSQWIEEVVVGLNFCPFAKKVLVNQQIDFDVIEDETIQRALESLLNKLEQMDAEPALETSLLIFNQGFGVFEDYLDLHDSASFLIEKGGYSGIYQLASFHPNYVFEGEPVDDASHFTNRSPHPMLHILREESMQRVLEQYPNPEAIPDNNIEVARNLGVKAFTTILSKCLRTNA